MDKQPALALIEQIRRQPDRPGAEITAQRLQEMLRSMAADGARRDDPTREIFARMGDKWSTLLLLLLSAGNFRHSLLRRLVSTMGTEGRISQRMLTLRLRMLERDGLIVRSTISTQPPGVEYGLTDLGRSLIAQIETMLQWIRAHDEQIRAARERFEQTAAQSQTEAELT